MEIAIMDEVLQSLQQEAPKIDVSVKNFLSVLIAKGQKDVPHSVSSSSNTVDSLANLPPHFLMDYARLLLQCLQSCVPLEYQAYFEQNPQPESQSASDRLDHMCKYKAICALRKHTIDKGGKVSKSFGKSYLLSTNIWPAIKSLFLSQLEDGTRKNLTFGEGQQFVELYERGLFGSDDSDLIWATDFNEALRQRHQERVKSANQRVNELTEEAIRNAISGGEGNDGDERSDDEEDS